MKTYEDYKDSGTFWIDIYPNHWELCKLKFSSRTIAGGTPDTKKREYWEGNIPWLPSGVVQNCDVYEEDADTFITKLGLEKSAAKMIPGDSVLIALTGATCANIAHLHFQASANQSVIAMPGSKKIYNRYLFYSLLAYRNQILINKTGGAQSGINDANVKNTEILRPPLPEQRQIAAYLDYKTNQIDRFIANRKKQIELLEEQKEAIINKAITVGIDNVDLEVIETHWYSLKPKNWELLKFNAAINLIHGFQFRDNDFTAEGIKIVKITQLNANGTLDLTNADTIDEKRLSSFKSRIIKNGDILMALTGGTIGKIIRVEDLDEIVLQNYRVGKFEPRYKNQLSKRYLFWVLRSEKTFAQINFLLRETGQPNIIMPVIIQTVYLLV